MNYFVQSQLNCEVLSPELGLEIRWSVDSKDILLQLVANMGKVVLAVIQSAAHCSIWQILRSKLKFDFFPY